MCNPENDEASTTISTNDKFFAEVEEKTVIKTLDDGLIKYASSNEVANYFTEVWKKEFKDNENTFNNALHILKSELQQLKKEIGCNENIFSVDVYPIFDKSIEELYSTAGEKRKALPTW